MSKNQKSVNNAVAIVGMSCRFPGANTPDEFWHLLQNRIQTIAEIPAERWDANTLYDPDPNAERKTHQRHASLLSNIHDFDPLFFNISPAEAIEMSPSQKLMLELGWEAIESSSIPFDKVKGNNVGVFVGNIWSDFEHYRRTKNARPTLHSAVGMSAPVVANRLSFALGLTGPSMVVDTGCSASLVALHLACQSILNGECSMAISGGINHIMDPSKYIELTRFGGLSLKGRCSSFDIDADGFVRGEGGAVLLLKKLEDAENDGDKILAVIKSTAVNNNGYNDTLPATSTKGQMELLEKAYSAAGIAPHEVHYVEAHGTGTKLGDPNEARAIGEFFKKGRSKKLRIGSVKTNIGHTEATAGIAGLVKVVLAMQKHHLPPNLHFRQPNPDIDFEGLNLEVQADITVWPSDSHETYKAGVNSFGWGGTNAHAVLEQYVHKPSEKSVAKTLYCLPLSAKSPAGLLAYAKSYAHLLETVSEEDFRSICVATALVKTAFDHRYLFSGTSRQEMLSELKTFITDNIEVAPILYEQSQQKMVFVFPGQGGQWLGMGRVLIEQNQVFRDMIDACEQAFKQFTDWSLKEQLHAQPENSRLNEINVIQPAIFAMQIALARVWMSWGIKPDVVVGHSMGEVAAAYISGALSLEDAACVICTRSKLMKTVSGTGGAMVVTELTHEEATQFAGKFDGKLSVAVNNSPKSTVLAGDKSAIDEVIAELEKQGLFCRLVKVDVASHSPQMDPLMAPLDEALQNIKPISAETGFFSTVRARVLPGESLNKDYWVKNLRGTVQFASVIKELLNSGHTNFLECNPHPLLVNAVNECADANNTRIITTSSTVREKDERAELRKNLNDLYSKGYDIDWTAFYGTTKAPHVNLPLYPFQREKFEIEDLSEELAYSREESTTFPLLGNSLNLADADNFHFWESVVSLEKFPFLKEHLVNEKILFPTSGYIEIILEAIAETLNDTVSARVEDLVFMERLSLSERENIRIQVKLVMNGKGGKVSVYKKDTETNSWLPLANGKVTTSALDSGKLTNAFEDLEYQGGGYTEGINYYNLLRSVGFDFGKQFNHITGLDRVNRTANKILFSIKADENIILTSGKYKVHPALLSAFFHPLLGQLTTILEEGNRMAVELNRISNFEYQGPVVYEKEIRGLLIMHEMVKTNEASPSWLFRADILIANFDNTPVLTIHGLEGTASMAKVEREDCNGKHLGVSRLLAELKTDHEKHEVLQQSIIQHVSRIIKISPNRIRNTMTFKGMGIDSLMAVQLRNLLEKEFHVKLPVGLFWSHPTISDYSLYLKEMLSGQNEILSLSETTRNKNEKWLVIPKPNPDASSRLFVFHDAGGSATLFDGWEDMLGPDIECIAIEMPGRGRRFSEAPITDTDTLIRELTPVLLPYLNKPFAFLGHSMGGLVAFEIIRELRRIKEPQPQLLFISSTSGLNAYEKSQVDYTLSNDELVSLYPHLDLSVIKYEELQSSLINILRGDLQFLYSYDYYNESPLDIPLVAIHGNEDERVSRYQIEQWEKETSHSFELISRTGGHRYIAHDGAFVTGLIQEHLRMKEMVPVEKENNNLDTTTV